jgi:hypothetical protein
MLWITASTCVFLWLIPTAITAACIIVEEINILVLPT